jgi:hypothetical protein
VKVVFERVKGWEVVFSRLTCTNRNSGDLCIGEKNISANYKGRGKFQRFKLDFDFEDSLHALVDASLEKLCFIY